ncbi:MAG: septum formation initiator family protein [Ignavibacteriales bacterium]|nr:septum formation initiator family protein [Ignavibacteriales bacterium]
MASKERKFVGFVIGVLFVAGSAFLLFNAKGFVAYYKLNQQVDSLKNVVITLEADNNKLQNSIDSLKAKVPAKIARLSRERYNMKKPNETIITVDEK